ncbi:DUF1295 domain-containing protein [Mycolicibacter icosiumassiliensis]|uniref:DUF1295 domain-containing protein n=1 Tax=Mycolicibacter icosiumassiliensis TaxID=1792835 RepID=UPI000ADF08B9|nr:DUF1295 domain-containing protein [Mycolicibacter icosiumassiliensis]
MSKAASLCLISSAYLVAIGVACVWLAWGPGTGMLWLDTLIADVLATLVVFVFSRRFGNSSFYDAYWSVIPPLLVAYWWFQSLPQVNTTRCVLIAVVVTLWAVRLTGNWVWGFPGLHHEDWRYPVLRQRAGRWEFAADLFGIHLVPTLQVFAGLAPVYVAVTRPDRGLIWLSLIAFATGIGAVVLELVADMQLHQFVRDQPPGTAMDHGVWGWSRHPNYFGEISFWLACALFGVSAAPAQAWWMFVGVLAMLAMFLGASIPMMESRSLQRRPEYQDVIDRVPRLFPRPPRNVSA